MDKIDNDILHNVICFLAADDLARLSCVSKKFKHEHEHISKMAWVEHAAFKWALSPQFINNYFPKLSSSELSQLYPISFPIISGINSDHHDTRNLIFDAERVAVDFVGRVGESNRSVQGNSPFPSRCDKNESTDRSSFIENMMTFASKMAEEFLKECDFPEFDMDDYDEPDVQRHSVPFARLLENGNVEFVVKPRFISYYEVEIKPSKYEHDPAISGFECVAVGLATKSFMKNKRLPGWDHESFGYHGDDGAIFHGQGKQLSEFGPRYGCNDTIGCGLNHKDNSIFFTCNGVLLGTAFENVPKDVDLYPTVGVDTNCSMHLNFGDRPFKFDLVAYMEAIDPLFST